MFAVKLMKEAEIIRSVIQIFEFLRIWWQIEAHSLFAPVKKCLQS